MKRILKAIFHSLPFRQFAFTVIRYLRPPESIFRHLYFKGVFNVAIDGRSKFKLKHYGFQIENEIFWKGLSGGWEKTSMGIWINLCKHSRSIIDVGANTGVYSLVAKAISPQAEVFAFEPVARVFEKLQENIRLNEFTIAAYPYAVSSEDGTAVFYDLPGDEHIYSVTLNKNNFSPEQTVKETPIKTIALDTFVRAHNLVTVDLVKIDVETHEPEVLEGFRESLGRFRPTLLIEILTEEVGEKVENILTGLCYLYFNIDERYGIRRTSTIAKSDYYNYLICTEEVAIRLNLYTK